MSSGGLCAINTVEATKITCTIPEGVGRDTSFYVTVRYAGGQPPMGFPGTDVFHYLPPVSLRSGVSCFPFRAIFIRSHKFQFSLFAQCCVVVARTQTISPGTLAVLNGIPTTILHGSRSLGETVTFEGMLLPLLLL